MIKHLLKIIWTQRKANGWIFAELVVAVAVLWVMLDSLYVDIRTYYAPLGYDIENTWQFKLNYYNPEAPLFVEDINNIETGPEDLRKLMDNIRQHPAVENVCVEYYATPYSKGSFWLNVIPVDGDTSKLHEQSFQVFHVSPEYFDVFRVKDVNGNVITPLLADKQNPIIISVDMEALFFPGLQGVGRRVKIDENGEEVFTVNAISAPIRENDYSRSESCLFKCLTGSLFNDFVNRYGAEDAELCVRMKRQMSASDMNNLLEEMGGRLTANNLYVYGVRSVSEDRNDQLKGFNDNASKHLSLMAFLLINVFFGIIGTFWLRTQHRRGESGIRMALGADRLTLKMYLYSEGLCILMLTTPFILFFIANMYFGDILDTYRQAYSALRFAITFGGAYLLMGAMICLGIWFPVQKTSRIAPAEALHYE
jgi:hypothetical protein